MYVDYFFQRQEICYRLIEFAVQEQQADFLWTIEKNTDAIRFYQRQGFKLTTDRKLEKDTTEYLVRMCR